MTLRRTLTAEPASHAKRMLPLLLTVFVLMLAGWMIWRGLFLNSDYFPVNELRLVGEFEQLQADEIKSMIEPRLKGNFFALPVDQIHSLVDAQPWVDQVWVDRIFPDTVRLRVSEQKPVARWGDQALLNRRGEMFVKGADHFEQLPLLRGPDNSIDEVMAFFHLAQKQLLDAGLNISQLEMDERHSWHMVVNDMTVMLGRDQLEQRLQRLTQYWEQVLTTDSRKVDKIDLRYANGFAVRWSDRSKPVNAVKS